MRPSPSRTSEAYHKVFCIYVPRQQCCCIGAHQFECLHLISARTQVSFLGSISCPVHSYELLKIKCDLCM